ncbi:MAG: hypothetical protein VB142_09070 [Burkholderia sp.]
MQTLDQHCLNSSNTLFISALPLFASFVDFSMVASPGSRQVRWLCF